MTLAEQCHAVRHAAGVFDRCGRGRLLVRGADRAAFLHALLTNDIASLRPGTGCYAAMLTPQGRMVSDMHVFELGGIALLDIPGARRDAVLAKLEQMIFSEDVQVADASDGWGCLSVQGPASAEAVSRALASRGANGAEPVASDATRAGGLSGFEPFQNARFESADGLIIAARADEFDVAGYMLFCEMQAVPALVSALVDAGGVVAGEDAAESLRIQAGVPACPADLADDIIPLEAGIESRAISFTKGCYPGQEVIVRIRDRGQGRVARRLVGLQCETGSAPAAGDALMADGRDVGRVSSVAVSAAHGVPIALAYAHRDASEIGRVLIVERAGVTIASAQVVPLPMP
jgi:folate-binding protein YgfZ